MASPLGLKLYNLANRSAPDGPLERPPRPVGPLAWLHAPSADNLPQIVGLAHRLEEELGLNILLTCPDHPADDPALIWQDPPQDNPAAARSFLDHWSPDVAIFADGELRPSTLHEADERRIPLVLVDARAPYFQRGREGWWPGLMRGLLASFQSILTIDQKSARTFRRAGAPNSIVRITGRLEYPSAALPCTEAERAELARLLATRPVWFAVALPEAEEKLVIDAHRAAMKLAHRLLLIVSPQEQSRVTPLAERMENLEGWTVSRRLAEEEPDPEVQVYITDANTEYGLWYRLAPITYLGGSLTGVGAIRDPMEAAALGSAIIHGPQHGKFGTAIGRLASAQATNPVNSSTELAIALSEMLSPDRSARLAQAAWGVASDGADATESAIGVIRQLVEREL